MLLLPKGHEPASVYHGYSYCYTDSGSAEADGDIAWDTHLEKVGNAKQKKGQGLVLMKA